MKYKPILPSERQETKAVIEWANYACSKYPYLERIFAIPNGQYRPGQRLEVGVKSGIPDLMLPVRVGKYAGLFIEMKTRTGGKLSKVQKEWISYLNWAGYIAISCNGADMAISVITQYYKDPDNLLANYGR